MLLINDRNVILSFRELSRGCGRMSTLRLLVDLPTPLSPYNTHEYTNANARTLSLGIAFVDY